MFWHVLASFSIFSSFGWVGLDMPLVVRFQDSVNDLWSVTSTLAKRTKLNSWVKTAALVFTSFWQDYIVFNVDAAWKVENGLGIGKVSWQRSGESI